MIDIRDSLDMAVHHYFNIVNLENFPATNKDWQEFMALSGNVVKHLHAMRNEMAAKLEKASQAERLRVWKLMKESHKRGADMESEHYRAEYDRLTNELRARGEV